MVRHSNVLGPPNWKDISSLASLNAKQLLTRYASVHSIKRPFPYWEPAADVELGKSSLLWYLMYALCHSYPTRQLVDAVSFSTECKPPFLYWTLHLVDPCVTVSWTCLHTSQHSTPLPEALSSTCFVSSSAAVAPLLHLYARVGHMCWPRIAP